MRPALATNLIGREQALFVAAGQWAAERPAPEGLCKSERAGFLATRSGVAAGDLTDVLHRQLGQRLGNEHVTFGVELGYRQHAGVVVETVGDLIGWQFLRSAHVYL